MIGRKLSHFEILEEIGSGGMGRVYLARDLDLRRTVALKVLPAGDQSREKRRRLLAEARAASALNHEAIVTIYEVGSEEDVDFIAMERVEGRDLARVLREEGPLDPERTRRLAIALAEALAAAHRAGVVHRDLKPGNIMITSDGRPKILDFGLAKRLAAAEVEDEDLATLTYAATQEGLLVGTPAYMAPEQVQGRGVDPRTDLFALGAVLYEMLTGERPFRGGRSVEVLSSVLHHHPPPPSRVRDSLPPEWDGLLDRLLAKDPAARYPDAAALVAALEGLGRERAARVRWAKTAAVGLATALALGALLLVLLVLGGRPGSPGSAAGDASTTDFPTYGFRLLADLPGSQRQPSFAPDGDRIAFVQEDAAGVPQIWTLDLGGSDPQQVTRGEEPSVEPRWDPAGGRIVFSRPDRGIWQVSSEGGAERQLLKDGYSPNVSPDGRRLSFVHDRRPWIAEGDGTDPRPLEGFERVFFGWLAYPAFSPSGQEIVTFWPHPERPLGDLWIAPVDGSAPPRRLTRLRFLPWNLVPVWTPDGRWIVFTSDHTGSINLWRAPVSGGEPEPVTRGAGSDYQADISADMRRLVYANGRNTAQLRLFDPATGQQSIAYQRRQLIIVPELSPSGDRVAFFSRAPGGFHLFVVDLDTGEARQVTAGDGIHTHPRWAPDGESLYYYLQDPETALRRISLETGEADTVIEEWRWPVQNHAAVAPGEKRLAYTLRDAGRLVETRVRNLESGEEWSLGLPLYGPRWSRDGTTIWGATWNPDVVYRCRVEPVACERLTEGGEVRLGPREESVYVLRDSPPEIWHHDLETGEERRVHRIEDHDPQDFNWGVLPDGRILHHAQLAGELELWLGEAEAGE